MILDCIIIIIIIIIIRAFIRRTIWLDKRSANYQVQVLNFLTVTVEIGFDY